MRITLAAQILAVLSHSAFAQEQIRITVEGNYPPFSQVAPDRSPSGFDFDIARGICEQMQAECTHVRQE